MYLTQIFMNYLKSLLIIVLLTCIAGTGSIQNYQMNQKRSFAKLLLLRGLILHSILKTTHG